MINNALDGSYVIIKLIKNSPKREAILKRIKLEYLDTDVVNKKGIRHFCHTRWTVKADALLSIIVNYKFLMEVFKESLDDNKTQGDVKNTIRGILCHMKKFDFYFGLYLGYTFLHLTDNLAKTLQTKNLTACKGQKLARMTVKDLEALKSDDEFDSFWATLIKNSTELEIDDPKLPRVRKRNIKYYLNEDISNDDLTPKEYFKKIYLETANTMIKFIQSRFDQPSYEIYMNLESLILNAASNECDKDSGEFLYKENLEKMLKVYGNSNDFDEKLLRSQLKSFSQNYPKENVSFDDIVEFFKDRAMKTFYSEIVKLIELILVIPGSNASSERYFSVLRRLKNYLRSTMGQERLNHCMVTTIYKKELMELDMCEILNRFVAINVHRKTVFGTFVKSDFE